MLTSGTHPMVQPHVRYTVKLLIVWVMPLLKKLNRSCSFPQARVATRGGALEHAAEAHRRTEALEAHSLLFGMFLLFLLHTRALA